MFLEFLPYVLIIDAALCGLNVFACFYNHSTLKQDCKKEDIVNDVLLIIYVGKTKQLWGKNANVSDHDTTKKRSKIM